MTKAKKSNKTNTSATFTVDAELTGISIPEISRLLDRKKLKEPTRSGVPVKKDQAAETPNLIPKISEGQIPLSQGPIPKDPSVISGSPTPNTEKPIEGIALVSSDSEFELTGANRKSPAHESELKEVKIEIPLPPLPQIEGIPIGKPPAAPPDPVLEPNEEKPKNHGMAQIQPAKKRTGINRNEKLVAWNKDVLFRSLDPLAKALTVLMKEGVEDVLFLGICTAEKKTGIPSFVAKAGLGKKERLMVWNGLVWVPKITPEVWNDFVELGSLEFPPPGTMTLQSSNRNLVRRAFGIQAAEWLTLVCVGPLKKPRGVITLVSKKSVKEIVKEVMDLLSAEVKAA